jgi:hypothetical protein
MALGITDRVWSIMDLIEAGLKAVPPQPTPSLHSVASSSG